MTPLELAARVRQHDLRCNNKLAAYFLGYWLEHGIVEETAPNHYELTPRGHDLAAGLAPDQGGGGHTGTTTTALTPRLSDFPLRAQELAEAAS